MIPSVWEMVRFVIGCVAFFGELALNDWRRKRRLRTTRLVDPPTMLILTSSSAHSSILKNILFRRFSSIPGPEMLLAAFLCQDV